MKRSRHASEEDIDWDEQLYLCTSMLDLLFAEHVQKCVESGANVNGKCTRYGQTALHRISGFGCMPVAEPLIFRCGADVTAKDNDERTPLHHACSGARDHDFTDIGGYVRIAQWLIDNGAEVDAKDSQGETSLVYACRNGRKDSWGNGLWEMAKLLVSRGANINMKTTQGSTPLQVAAEQNHLDVVWCLVRQCPGELVS